MGMDLPFPILVQTLAPDLPKPVAEYRFHPRRRWRFDYAWPEYKVAVEIDGGQWKPGGGRHNTDADREKLNTAAAMGWRVLRFSHKVLREQPGDCVELLVLAINGEY